MEMETKMCTLKRDVKPKFKHLWAWDEIENELTEIQRPDEWIAESNAVGWPLVKSFPDGVMVFEGERHQCFAIWAASAEEAHSILLNHPKYLEFNETEA